MLRPCRTRCVDDLLQSLARPAVTLQASSLCVRASAVNDTPFLIVLYRYFFFGWLFKDAGTGTLLERAANARFNRDQARWLPTYVMRWLWLGLLFYAVAGALDLLLDAPALAILFYAASVMSVSFTLTIGVAWMGIRGVRRLQ